MTPEPPAPNSSVSGGGKAAALPSFSLNGISKGRSLRPVTRIVTTAGMTRSSIGAKDPPGSSTVAAIADRMLGSDAWANVAVGVRICTKRSRRMQDRGDPPLLTRASTSRRKETEIGASTIGCRPAVGRVHSGSIEFSAVRARPIRPHLFCGARSVYTFPPVSLLLHVHHLGHAEPLAIEFLEELLAIEIGGHVRAPALKLLKELLRVDAVAAA